MTSGIPQGTGIGPILYISGTNSVVKYIIYSLIKMLVDDYDFYQNCFVHSVNNAISKLNFDLNELFSWSRKMEIEIKLKKTKSMILGSTYNLNRIDVLDISPIVINNTIIPFVNTFKNLGVQISRDLFWNEQILAIVSKVKYSLTSFYRRARFFPRSVNSIVMNF